MSFPTDPVRYVAFLRGMNLGKRRPPMARLKSLFEELGYTDVETFIASGNVIFNNNSETATEMEAHIAAHLQSSLGYQVDTFIRTDREVAKIGMTTIFREEVGAGNTLHVVFLQQELSPSVARKLESVRTDYDEFRVRGREFYWLCRGPISNSKVWTLPQMKTIKLPTSTMRNINSIRKLVEKHIR